MEYDQAETAEFAEKKNRWFSIGRWALLFFLFGFVCVLSTYWVLTMPDGIFSGKNQALLDETIDKNAQPYPSTKASETRLELENDLFDINRRLINLEKNFADKVLKLDILSSESIGANENLTDLQQLVASIQEEVRGLEIEHEDTQNRQTILLLTESYLNRAYRCLELDDTLVKCLDQIKKAEELSEFFQDKLRTIVLRSIKDYRIWLDDLYQRSLQAQTNDFNELVVLVSELATAKNSVDWERLDLNRADEEEKENLPRSSLSSSIIEALKGLVIIKKIDHQLLNQYSVADVNRIKLSFQLESATARIAFLTNDAEATQISINNLKNLSNSYLDESTPLARLISKLEAKKLVTPPIARDKLDELRLKIREFRQSPRLLN
tara:strand:- start:2691 stop:3830 length:1140 start_codon:yes stop_codon:yes gene_type:complete